MSPISCVDEACDPGRSEFYFVRGLRYHLRCWGDPRAPTLWLLHGWLDVSATFAAVAAGLSQGLQVLAPDWRGFGLTQWAEDGYWFMDYVGDLDALLAQRSPDSPVRLAGHSMGAQVAAHYAGLRPGRVARLALLDGLLLPDAPPEGVVARQRLWLDQLCDPLEHKVYRDYAEMGDRLRRLHPRLAPAAAEFVARCWGQAVQGGVRFSCDPRHRRITPIAYRLAESMAVWRCVRAPTLFLDGAASTLAAAVPDVERRARRACFAERVERSIAGAGHMLHFDAPAETAAELAAFFAS